LITAFIILVGSFLIQEPPSVFNKFKQAEEFFSEKNHRQRIRNFSYELARLDPILGVGMGSFPNYKLSDIKQNVIKEKGLEWWINNSEGVYSEYAHPHNLYYHYLVGGGVTFLFIMISYWVYVLMKVKSQIYKGKFDWTGLSALNVAFIILAIGIVNTTLESENAMLSFLILGIFFSRLRFNEY